jgi:hypothetical protein
MASDVRYGTTMNFSSDTPPATTTNTSHFQGSFFKNTSTNSVTVSVTPFS